MKPPTATAGSPRRRAAALLLGLVALCFGPTTRASAESIDRRALVERHTLHFDRLQPQSPASLGNGEFAFSFDITGLQTFPGDEAGGMPFGTMAQWAWHTFPESKEFLYEDTLHEYDVHGRKVSYATDMESDAARAIRANPHRFNLARVGLRLLRQDGTRAKIDDLNDTQQTVSLWSGEAISRFTFEGQPVQVRTVVHPSLDALGIWVESPLAATGRVAVEVSFAYPAGEWGPRVDDWNSSDRHQTQVVEEGEAVRLVRTLDETRYAVGIRTNGSVGPAGDVHTLVVGQPPGGRLEAVLHFTPEGAERKHVPVFTQVRVASEVHWAWFWSRGGAIDLSASSDPRWRELERRIVLSQYLSAAHCAGSMPPQETGLMCNSWFGKSHLEMHWWHAAHFPLWGRADLLERSLGWYQEVLPAARAIAERQGYAGIRWPKMTGPRGVSSPSSVGELLIWQQPHPIFFAELLYRAKPEPETLNRYSEIVFETARFMADYACFNESQKRYELGPVLIPAQECYDGRTPPGVLNPTFELAYWRWGLQTANHWRERLGQEADPHWTDVAEQIARPKVHNGTYAAIETPPFLLRRDHPSMLGAFGVLPDVGLVDRDTMRRTLSDVRDDWQWDQTWGWDFPMMAMTAARLGDRRAAVDLLLLDTPKNQYLPNGHCRQEDRLPVYLPANGGLLTAVAMMAAGWDAATGPEPGFPEDGSWTVRHEGLQPAP